MSEQQIQGSQAACTVREKIKVARQPIFISSHK